MATSNVNNTYLTPSSSPKPSSGSSGATKPTLLAFHGSGSNSTIHIVQLARLARHLKPDFEIESLEAPFPSPAGPGILPFFEGMGPYKRWLPPSEKLSLDSMKAGTGLRTMPPEVEDLVRSTVLRIRAQGGKVVGLIGFSQGTKVVAGLLRGCEIRRVVEATGVETTDADWLDFQFGLSVCGSYPPPLVPSSATSLLTASSLSLEQKLALETAKIQLPTLHMLGSEDEWAWTGKLLIKADYEVGEGKSEVREIEGGHHYPQKAEATDGIVEWVGATWGKVAGEVRG
ncbi:citrinin biosynthesis oxidoreductase-like protein CtnB [Melanomma pulvis-pyrius CBS 109.77]|uniref:Citrinin biosynthesis oxidoreductase-like protein CtnB n=1 Tax=Melanomma pulvis-pyrius CBS 109.77 TaxID=1314802 RepID=A0A6A6WY10_9PLEO|nr:citrinin biosynthesis oxidoreductase-like protein CtnB [Melanomma pulvis-pyrius CBS 109.77]